MEITFYVLADHDPAARLHTACRLIEKAFKHKHEVWVQAASRLEAEQLDELLWTFKAESFIPHHLLGDGPAPPPPVRIGWAGQAIEGRGILLNLSAEVPENFRRCQRILEIVGGDDAMREAARSHWRHYKQQGLQVDAHNL